MEVGEEGERLLHISLHCHHLNDSCIKMGSDESHLNVSFIVRNKVTVPRTSKSTNFRLTLGQSTVKISLMGVVEAVTRDGSMVTSTGLGGARKAVRHDI